MKFKSLAQPVAMAFPLFFKAAAALADGSNPFDLTTTVATDWTGYAKTAAIAIAGLAGTIVIILGMFGVLRLRWAFQIGGGLIALTGLGWVISALQGSN